MAYASSFPAITRNGNSTSKMLSLWSGNTMSCLSSSFFLGTSLISFPYAAYPWLLAARKIKTEKKSGTFIKTTYDISLDSQISLLPLGFFWKHLLEVGSHSNRILLFWNPFMIWPFLLWGSSMWLMVSVLILGGASWISLGFLAPQRRFHTRDPHAS